MTDVNNLDRNSLLDQAAISFNHLLGDPSHSNNIASSIPHHNHVTATEPALYIRVKEENESLKLRVDSLELELA